jgi:rifampicin phosphotransferase
VIERISHVYPCMLGLIHGRIYYNLPSWFRVLSLLPGFGSNARHMETMMGLKEPLPQTVMKQISRDIQAGKTGVLAMISSVAGLVLNFVCLGRSVRAFYTRVEDALTMPVSSLSDKSALELGRYYRLLESKLLKKWDAPIANDFFAMIFYGVLRNLCGKWCGDQDGSLQNRLISKQTGIISAEPARRIRKMASLAKGHPTLVTALRKGDVPGTFAEAAQYPEFLRELNEYLEQFGDRCLEELKLETETLNDSPELLFRSIAVVASHAPVVRADTEESASDELQDSRILSKLNPLQRMIFQFVLAQTKERIKQRENLRFLRTRVFGRVRRLFLEIGRKFVAGGLLRDARDIFYLEVEEALAILEGTSTCANISALVDVRKVEFEKFKLQAEPPVRITTLGLPALSLTILAANQFEADFDNEENNPASGRIKGTPCSPGKVRGRVRVITEPSAARMEQGDIIVARRTDPGWILLFPAAAGLIVEHGSLLSHSAIVSRELGLPAIVGVCNATRVLKEGDLVEFDGKTGYIEIVERAEASNVLAA